MKYKLVAELPQSLRRRISCIVSLSCSASWTGLQKAASQVSAASKQQLQKSEGDVVEEFLKCIQAVEKTTTYEVCYGEAETARALEMGAVKQLLISDNCANLEKWKTRAISCGSQTTEIQSATDSSVFCKGYKIGAVLRWRMNLSMEEMEEMTNIDSESESEASTATPTSLEDTLPWLQEALEQAGYDETSVEALTIGVDVVLSCNAQTPEERFNDALQLLQSQDVPTQVLEDFCLLVGDTFSDDSFDWLVTFPDRAEGSGGRADERLQDASRSSCAKWVEDASAKRGDFPYAKKSKMSGNQEIMSFRPNMMQDLPDSCGHLRPGLQGSSVNWKLLREQFWFCIPSWH